MHVLLTNDDGIHAPGIRALGEVFRAAGHRVSVCAPDRERSAASHSVTLTGRLHARETAVDWADRAWAVDGTPADCASLGLYLTRNDGVDLVIAGINRGMNLGGACIYSGTVAAAMEASMCGTPGLAVSLCTVNRAPDDDYGPSARLALRVAAWALEHPLPLGVIYNLNVPLLPYGKLRGLVPGTLAPVFLDPPVYDEARDGDETCYIYGSGQRRTFDDPLYDLVRVNEGYATLTKLTWDFRMNADDAELGEIRL